MLIVLLVLLTATALATAGLQGTQYELRSSGYNRSAVQMEYVSEAGATNTIAWLDAISPMPGALMQQFGGTALPDFSPFGEPPLLTDLDKRHYANRTTWYQQQSWTTVLLPPISNADTNTNVLNVAPDTVGTFGPRSAYIAGVETRDKDSGKVDVRTNYVVDMYDCRQLTATASAGNQVNYSGSGTLKTGQFYCVVTSRGRSYLPSWTDPASPTGGDAVPRKKWTIAGNATYDVSRFTMAHDSRGTIITPPVSLQ